MAQSKRQSKTKAAADYTNKWKRVGAAAIFILSFFLYINSFNNGYTNDDVFVTAQNPVVARGIRAIPEIIRSPFITIQNNSFDFRPVSKITFAIEAGIFDVNPHASHLTQALLYACSCVLLFFLLVKILHSYSILLPLTASLLFAFHPIHTEVVDGLKNRDELLTFLCGIGVIYTLIRWEQEQKNKWYAIALSLFALSLFCKLSAGILLLWVPVVLYFMNPSLKLKRAVTVVGGLLLVLISYFAVVRFLIFPSAPHGLSRVVQYVENPAAGSRDILLLTSVTLHSLWFYLSKLIFPHPLAWYYGYNTIPVDKPFSFTAMVTLLIYLTALVVALYGWRRRTILSLSILLYLTAIVPSLSIFSPLPGIVGERFAFFASVGFCLAAAYALMKLTRTETDITTAKPTTLFSVTAILILMLCTVKVVSRNTDYKDNLTLYKKDLSAVNNSVLAHFAYGQQLQENYINAGKRAHDRYMIDSALVHFRKSYEIYPENTFSYLRIAEILSINYQSPVQALPYYNKALSISPAMPEAWFGKALCYSLMNKNDSALIYYRKAMQTGPAFLPSWENIAITFSRLEMNDSAIYYTRMLLKKNPASENAYANMGFFFKNKSETDSAKHYFEKTLLINSGRKDVQKALNEINLNTGSGATK